MKILLYLTFLSILFVTSPVFSEQAKNENIAIDKVVVFADRAEVTRAARTGCSGSSVDVVFSMLPMSLDERTLPATFHRHGYSASFGHLTRL